MTQPILEETSPSVAITLYLGPALSQVAANLTANTHMQQSIEQTVALLLGTLGIPGHPQVELLPQPETESDNHAALFRLNVDGRPCRFSDDLVLQAFSYVERMPLAVAERLLTVVEWLHEDMPDDANSAVGERAAELLALTCSAALMRQPGLLLGPAAVERYSSDLDLATPLSIERLRPILRRVVDLGISIADHAIVRRILSDELFSDQSVEDAAEQLIAALRPKLIEVRVEPNYLRQLTLDNVAKGPEMFPFMRNGLFVELGLTFPDFHFVPDATLKPGAFVFTINHLATLPLIGLPADTILVNDTADRLRLMNITGKPSSNPTTMQPASLVDGANKALLEAAGLTAWDQMDYMILCFAAVLRRGGYMLVDRELTNTMLKQLGQAFPDLEQPTRTYVSLDALTRVLRALVAEEISIRNLPRILERLIEYEVCIDADRPADRVAFVRAGLSDYIAYKYAGGTQTLVVYLLDPEIEQTFAVLPMPEVVRQPAEGLDDAHYTRIATAMWTEIGYLPPTAQIPVILTKDSLRAVVRATLAQEFPRSAVISYADIPPDYNIQPVARISWQ